MPKERPKFKVAGSKIRLKASSSTRQEESQKVTKRIGGRCPTCGKK